MDEWVDGEMGIWIDRLKNEWMDGWVVEPCWVLAVWLDEWRNDKLMWALYGGQMDERIERKNKYWWMNEIWECLIKEYCGSWADGSGGIEWWMVVKMNQ